jgi:hypothetical protein
MEKVRRFIHEHVNLDYDSPDHHYLVIIEIDDDEIIASYVVKVPAPYLRATINPYCKN